MLLLLLLLLVYIRYRYRLHVLLIAFVHFGTLENGLSRRLVTNPTTNKKENCSRPINQSNQSITCSFLPWVSSTQAETEWVADKLVKDRVVPLLTLLFILDCEQREMNDFRFVCFLLVLIAVLFWSVELPN